MSGLRIPRFVRLSAPTAGILTHVILFLAAARVFSAPRGSLGPAEAILIHQACHGMSLSSHSFLILTGSFAQKSSQSFRVEKDTFGELRVPSDRYWGAQTQR
jgi:hypothetical protein